MCRDHQRRAWRSALGRRSGPRHVRPSCIRRLLARSPVGLRNYLSPPVWSERRTSIENAWAYRSSFFSLSVYSWSPRFLVWSGVRSWPIFCSFHSWCLLFPPIANAPELNVVKAGRVVAVQFSLGGDQGLAILAAGSPVSVPVNCRSREPIGAEEPTVTPGGGITYMASTDTYLYEWKTSKGWTDCRRLIITLADGTRHHADSRFK